MDYTIVILKNIRELLYLQHLRYEQFYIIHHLEENSQINYFALQIM